MTASKLGFIFELGFGLGAYSYFKQKGKVSHSLEQCLDQELGSSRMGRENLLSRYRSDLQGLSRDEIGDNVVNLMWKGFISGYNFCREFIESKTKLRDYRLEYFQANFSDPINEEERGLRDSFLKKSLKLQLGIDISLDELQLLLQKGEYLQADLIVMVCQRKKRHILVVDNAISLAKVIDFGDIDDIKRSLQSTLFQKRLKNKFDNLSIDPGEVEGFKISEALSEYVIALNKTDKPIFKLIQAGSYAHSLKKFLEARRFMKEGGIKSATIVGYTDEEISSLSMSGENIDFLEAMEKTLKKCNDFYRKADRSNIRSSFEEKKRYTFNRLRTNFKEMFGIEGRLSELLSLERGLNHICIRDKLTGYQNTVGSYSYKGCDIPFREAHKREVISQIRDRKNQMLFLTGNPGIGKTHAVVDYLKSEESYIFLYLSPRTQVNRDIEQKFKVNDSYYSDDFIYLNASGSDEKILNSEEVNIVNFASNDKTIFDGVNTSIEFKPLGRERDYSSQFIAYEHKSRDEYSERKSSRKGVLSRLSMGIESVVEKRISKRIVATASIQSLKMTRRGSTGKHISRIFSGIINEKTRAIDGDAFNKFAKDYENVIIMVDEITGDSAGVALLNEIVKVVCEGLYAELNSDQKSRINIKIIVADASIVDLDIVEKHISNSSLDVDKIYYKPLKEGGLGPLDVQWFRFRGRYESVYINSNSYPARELSMNYNLVLDMIESNDDFQVYDNRKEDVIDDLISKRSFKHIVEGAEQIIIYVQDIGRLRRIVNKLDREHRERFGRSLEKYNDYIEIHSSISDSERESILKNKDGARYVLMTSSASRGISFPKATKFIVDIPKFSIETNLMEILQLIYRGRGDLDTDELSEKQIDFYIGMSSYYSDDFRLKSLETLSSLMSTMMILKSSILTRIKGGSILGKRDFAIIPIGAKGVDSGETMSLDVIGVLLRDMRRELKRGLKDEELESVNRALYEIFKSVKLELSESIFLEKDIEKGFKSRWKDNLRGLTDFKPLKDAYILGDLAIFKLDKAFDGIANLSAEKREFIEKCGLIERMRYLSSSRKDMSNGIRINMGIVANILEFFVQESKGKSMKFTDKGESGYIAIPLMVPFTRNVLKSESSGEQGVDGDVLSMRRIIEMYVRSEYQIRDVYPFTEGYSDYPFILFRSDSIEGARSKMFNGENIFCSKEINLLKLIVSN